jgi:hypothetical protein
MNILELRKSLLTEALSSPNLLSDLAGLEGYIAESYNNRSFIELLQNADDAGATKFKIIRSGDLLFVANNGRSFNEQDLESLCRSASSNKVRGETIGYRGIGFKSVVGFAKEIHILSGEYELTFSKEKTKIEIPEASFVPLIRIPHEISYEVRELISPTIDTLYLEKFSTIFIFSGITAQEIHLEFDTFDPTSLMFLRNICETEFCTSEIIQTKVTKDKVSNSEIKLTIKNNSISSEWLLYSANNCTIAYSAKENIIQRLPDSESFIYAFLPTENTCGLGVLINGDFSTDPSRKHLIYDTRTNETINSCCNLILNILEEKIADYDHTNFNIVNTLIPFSDPRMLQFKKTSFETLLLEGIKNINSIFFNSLRLCPNWLNSNDYSIIMQSKGINTINSKYLNIDGFVSFAKYLGAKEDTFNSLLNGINSVELSTLGCAQFIVQIFKSTISGIIKPDNIIDNLKLLISNKERVSFSVVKKNELLLDESFISLLIENGLTEFDIKYALKQLISNEYSEKHFPSKINDVIVSNTSDFNDSFANLFTASQNEVVMPIKGSIARWRSAEEITLEILNLNGFKLEDVSKQNIGYDLEGFTANGIPIQIEVKSITFPGQQFRITNNEIAVAQDKKESYNIAIVRQLDDFIEIALVSNPAKNLKLNRQCVQWIWECSEYEYKPIKFKI